MSCPRNKQVFRPATAGSVGCFSRHFQSDFGLRIPDCEFPLAQKNFAFCALGQTLGRQLVRPLLRSRSRSMDKEALSFSNSVSESFSFSWLKPALDPAL